MVSRDSSVGIVTRYGVDSPEIESRWEARFSAPVHTGPGPHPASCTMGTGSFLGVKRRGSGVDHTHSSSAKVKERVELYLYFPSGPSWLVLGWILRGKWRLWTYWLFVRPSFQSMKVHHMRRSFASIFVTKIFLKLYIYIYIYRLTLYRRSADRFI
jgi:hypothetical protein